MDTQEQDYEEWDHGSIIWLGPGDIIGEWKIILAPIFEGLTGPRSLENLSETALYTNTCYRLDYNIGLCYDQERTSIQTDPKKIPKLKSMQ